LRIRDAIALNFAPGGKTVSEQYHVRVSKDSLIFSAAHFITFAGDVCERLHGHNYGVAVEVHGPLDANQYVIDFIALRDATKGIVEELDHHMLLPTGHPQIKVVEGTTNVDVTFNERRWSFPREDCALLPVANTTAELLAHFIGHRLLDELQRRTGVRPQRLSVAVDECAGQWGMCDLIDE
jgi:6-pyruvoyltetrahydropterin/6-carboxytetrahydropterin synthase